MKRKREVIVIDGDELESHRNEPPHKKRKLNHFTIETHEEDERIQRQD